MARQPANELVCLSEHDDLSAVARPHAPVRTHGGGDY
jgi:hypothetical protein